MVTFVIAITKYLTPNNTSAYHLIRDAIHHDKEVMVAKVQGRQLHCTLETESRQKLWQATPRRPTPMTHFPTGL